MMDRTEKIPLMRVDRLLSNLGYGSRREIHRLVSHSLVTLDAKPLRDASDKIVLEPTLTSRMWVEGQPLDPLSGMILMLHKPLGVTCSHKEDGSLVYDLFPDRWRHRSPPLSTVGRLDKETSGLLLLTDDGDFLHRVISPRSQVTKRYHVTLASPLQGNETEIFASGKLVLPEDTKPLLPAQLVTLSSSEAYLTISEGRYHQVRRMFAAMNNTVTALHRDRIGNLDLPKDLSAGGYRFLSSDDVASVLAVPQSLAKSSAITQM